MMHELKELRVYFEATRQGDKYFTIRQNDDRGFQKGDSIFVRMVEDPEKSYQADITHVCTYAQKEGYVVLGFQLTHIDYKPV